MRKFKHKQTEVIGEVKEDGYLHFKSINDNVETLYMGFVEDTDDWEEVAQDWEVTKFKSGFGELAILMCSGLYLSEVDLVEHPSKDFKGRAWKIETIKRLSDGVEFSVGDVVNFNDYSYGKITGITWSDEKIVVSSDNLDLDINTITLRDITTFTTEDGEVINFGDEFFAVTLSNLKITKTKSPNFTLNPQKYKRFYNQRNANNYKITHIKCLSLFDIRNLMVFNDSKLIDLVKTRIKL